MKYRADIDGLRAVAVAPVVFFHLGVASFGGGFAGVDVFFVISGYLITSIIIEDVEAGRFSVGGFFLRRCRRLFPALFVVLLASTLAAYALLMPYDLRNFGISLVGTALSVSNFVFASQVGYFDASALTKPLLHTWSLAVEEQFYILLAIGLPFVVARGRRSVLWTLAFIAMVSLAMSVGAVANAKTAAYYHLTTRGFELLTGSILATGLIPAIRSRALSLAASMLGLAALGYTFLAFTEATPFPGLAALLPVSATALLIHAGASSGSLVQRALSIRPIVAVGRLSYPIYLWHWPLIVFWTYFSLEAPDPREQLIIIVVTLVLAFLTTRYVETPIRRLKMLGTTRTFGRFIAAGSVGMIAAGLLAGLTNGLPRRISAEALHAESYRDTMPPIWKRCKGAAEDGGANTPLCVIGDLDSPDFDFALLGDSHAFATAEAIGERARQYGLKGVLFARMACPPLLDVERQPEERRRCADNSSRAMKTIEELGIGTVIIVARWSLYMDAERVGLEARRAYRIFDGMEPSNDDAVFIRGFERTLGALEGKQIAIMKGIPEIGFSAPSAVARRLQFGLPAPQGPTLAAYQKRQEPFSAAIKPLIEDKGDRVVLIDPTPSLCPEGRCLVANGDEVLYYDDDHLSSAGSTLLAQAFDPFFASLFEKAAAEDPSRIRRTPPLRTVPSSGERSPRLHALPQ